MRKNGDSYELTKKEPINEGDASQQKEQTIILTKIEFDALNNQIDGKKVRKIRYLYEYEGRIAEFDIFMDDLFGLVLIDFEFETTDEKENFTMPDFCLIDITQEVFIAGGMICGKTYQDIVEDLNKFNYEKLFLK